MLVELDRLNSPLNKHSSWSRYHCGIKKGWNVPYSVQCVPFPPPAPNAKKYEFLTFNVQNFPKTSIAYDILSCFLNLYYPDFLTFQEVRECHLLRQYTLFDQYYSSGITIYNQVNSHLHARNKFYDRFLLFTLPDIINFPGLRNPIVTRFYLGNRLVTLVNLHAPSQAMTGWQQKQIDYLTLVTKNLDALNITSDVLLSGDWNLSFPNLTLESISSEFSRVSVSGSVGFDYYYCSNNMLTDGYFASLTQDKKASLSHINLNASQYLTWFSDHYPCLLTVLLT